MVYAYVHYLSCLICGLVQSTYPHIVGRYIVEFILEYNILQTTGNLTRATEAVCAHTHTHTHTYIYNNIDMCTRVYRGITPAPPSPRVVVFPSSEFVPRYCVGVAKMGVQKFQTAICGIVEMRLYYIKSPPSVIYVRRRLRHVCACTCACVYGGKVSSPRITFHCFHAPNTLNTETYVKFISLSETLFLSLYLSLAPSAVNSEIFLLCRFRDVVRYLYTLMFYIISYTRTKHLYTYSVLILL